MAWARIDDNFFNHPKVRKAGKDAVVFYVAALCHCNAFMTEGFIADEMLELVGMQSFQRKPKCLADLLVDCNLLDRVEGGYLIHDFLDYNYSKQQVDEIKSKRAAAGRIGGKQTQSKSSSKIQAKSEQTVKQNSSHTHTHINTHINDPIKDSLSEDEKSWDKFADAFQELTGLRAKPTKTTMAMLANFLERNVTVDEYRRAIQEMQAKNYTITNMDSAETWVMNNRKPSKSLSAGLDEILADAPIFAEDK